MIMGILYSQMGNDITICLCLKFHLKDVNMFQRDHLTKSARN